MWDETLLISIKLMRAMFLEMWRTWPILAELRIVGIIVALTRLRNARRIVYGMNVPFWIPIAIKVMDTDVQSISGGPG